MTEQREKKEMEDKAILGLKKGEHKKSWKTRPRKEPRQQTNLPIKRITRILNVLKSSRISTKYTKLAGSFVLWEEIEFRKKT